jgi:hypothetical protein
MQVRLSRAGDSVSLDWKGSLVLRRLLRVSKEEMTDMTGPIQAARAIAAGSAAAFALGACAKNEVSPAPAQGAERAQVDSDVMVSIAADGAGYAFSCAPGENVDADCNIDFGVGATKGNAVRLTFGIADGSVEGIRFVDQGEDALWIELKSAIGESSPTGPYRGDQFKGFATQEGGRRMHVIDKNDDGETYRYALRFDLNGTIVQYDPDLGNGN